MSLRNFLALRCPVCKKGKIFEGYFDTPERCPACGFFFMREAGYFLPHVPIGYIVTVGASLGSWPLLTYVFGVTSAVVTLTVMVLVAIFFGVWSLRYAKMLWLVIDLKIHPPVKEDFETRGRSADESVQR
jgi:uncharacterized protein (DUF983 family)